MTQTWRKIGFDTSQTMTVEKSPLKLFGHMATLVIFLLLGKVFVEGRYVESMGQVTVFVGWLAVISAGVGIPIMFYQFLFQNKSVLTLGPKGLLDTRISNERITWSSFSEISLWAPTIPRTTKRVRRAIILKTYPKFEPVLPISWFHKFWRPLQKSDGVYELCVGSSDLKIDFEDLFCTIVDYAKAHNRAIKISNY